LRYLQKLLYKPQQSGCVLHLINKSPSATAFDNSGYSNNGTITGATWVKLKSGLWVNSFAATNVIRCGTSIDIGTSDFSFLTWAKVATSADWRAIFFNMSGPVGYNWMFQAGTDKVRLEMGDSTGTVSGTSTSAAADNVWHLIGISATRTGNVIFYKDGRADGTLDISTKQGSMSNAAQQDIGYDATIGQYPTTGFYGLERIILRALPASEIANIYQWERHLLGI
jgi:hypothetical protein